MQVVIVGGHRLAYFLTRRMTSKGDEVAILNRDIKTCETIAQNPKILVINADHTDPRAMRDAGMQEADVVIALAEEDPENFIICKMASVEFGCTRTVALVNDPDYEHVFKQLGVNVSLSIVDLLTSLLEEHLVAEAIHDMLYIEGGKLVVTEIKIPDSSPAAGKKLRHLNLPEDAILAAWIRDGDTVVPRGDTELQAGDKVILVTSPASQGSSFRILAGKDVEEL